MIVRETNNRHEHLSLAPPASVLIFTEKRFAVFWHQFPRAKCKDLIDFCKLGHLRIDSLEALTNPVEVAPGKDESLAEDIKQVVAIKAADCHDAEVVLDLNLEAVLVHYAVK